jgi:hypothetical protein
MRIKNTLRLGEFWVSTALLGEVERDPSQQILAGPVAVPFDSSGNLLALGHQLSAVS